jgi:alkylation response protein AidB-like acyl-CoA dehydrogenase
MIQELRYHPDADQLALANTFNDSLESLLEISRLHQSHQESDDTWSMLESLGLFGIGLSEEEGGSGLGMVEEALIVMALGRSLAAPSVLATIGAMHAAPGNGLKPASGMPRTAAAYRHGERTVIIEDSKAQHVLVRVGAETSLYEYDAFQLQALDEQLWHAQLCASISRPEPIAQFDGAGLLRLALLDASALSGIAEVALEMSVSYAGERKQFGRPIGGFQAVKHHCANMAIAARCARDQTSFASVAVDDQREDAALQVDCALLTAGTAAIENCGKNIQIHAGIGFSDEADPHLLLKRAQLLISLAGGLEAVNSRVADARTGT